MAILDGSTRTKIAELAVLIGNWEMERADASFREIVHTLRDEALTLASPELRELVKGFHKTRQRKLSELLERTLAGGSLEEEVSPLILATPESARQRGDRYAAGLDGLRDKHIFQWVNHYRPYIRYIFRDMIEQLRDRATWDDEIIELELVFAEHSQDIFERGFSFTTEKGFQFDVAIAKSAGGLQRFVYLIMSLLVEETGLIRGAPAARLAWDVVSSMISGVLRGYGRSDFGTKSGWVVLLGCTRVWLPALGFVPFARGFVPFARGFVPVSLVLARRRLMGGPSL